jgi:Protein of unknown function (DUF2637)
VTARADRWIRLTTIGCVGLLALIAGTVSYLHMHLLVELHGQPGWVAVLTPLSVDGMIVAASTTLLADSRSARRGGLMPWALLVIGSLASLAANVSVSEPTATGRVIAAWPSFALIAAYELLMRQVRNAAETATFRTRRGRPPGRSVSAAAAIADGAVSTRKAEPARGRAVGKEVRLEAWRWAQNNRREDGSLPAGRDIGTRYSRHERWGRMVKRSGLAGGDRLVRLACCWGPGWTPRHRPRKGLRPMIMAGHGPPLDRLPDAAGSAG